MNHHIRHSLLLTFLCYATLDFTMASTQTATPSTLPACVQDGTCKYTISTFAGSNPGDSDGTTSTATFNQPTMAIFDSNQNMYVLDNNNKIRKIDKNGNVTTIINSDKVPGSIAVDTSGNFYLYDRNNPKIFKYQNGSYNNPVVIAGNDASGTPGYATGASFNAALSKEAWGGLIIDSAGNLYISDTWNHVIKKLTLRNDAYTLSIIAGTNKSSGYDNNTTNGNKAVGAKLNQPQQLALDAAGNVYIGDYENHAIRKLTPNADGSYTISTVAGTGSPGFSGDGGPATNAKLTDARAIAVDSLGNLYISDVYNRVIRFVSAKTGIISTIAGTISVSGFSDNNGTALGARLSKVFRIMADNAGNIYFPDTGNNRIRKLTPIITPAVTTITLPVVTTTTPVTTTASTSTTPTCPTGSSNSYSVSTFAGNGNSSNIDGPAAQSSFSNPHVIVEDSVGNFYVADSVAANIRKIDPAGNVTTIISGYTASALFIDKTNKNDTLYVVDYGNGQLKKYNGTAASINAQNAAFTIIASNASTASTAFSPGAVLNANLRAWGGIVIDGTGNIYMTDNNQIRRLTPPAGANTSYTLTTIAGSTQAGIADGPCTTALFDGPEGMTISDSGKLYIADKNNHVIRRIDFSGNNCAVKTIIGTPNVAGYSGDCGVAQNAKLNKPTGIVIAKNNFYIADSGNHSIRFMQWGSSIISTIAGPVTAPGATPSSGYTENNGQAIGAQFKNPWRIVVDTTGNVYVTDAGNSRIRKLTFLGVK